MHTVTIEIPDELSSKEVSLSIAKQLYEKNLVSADQAAKLADVDVKEFVESEIPSDDLMQRLAVKRPFRTMEEVFQQQIRERSYTGADKEKADALRDKLDIQEPLEVLLSQLTK